MIKINEDVLPNLTYKDIVMDIASGLWLNVAKIPKLTFSCGKITKAELCLMAHGPFGFNTEQHNYLFDFVSGDCPNLALVEDSDFVYYIDDDSE